MNTLKRFGLFAACAISIGLIGACKTTGKIGKTDTKTDKVDETVAAADTSSPLNKLETLSNTNNTSTTDVVDEGKSGMDAKLPFDKNVRTGVLDNGMRYYIRKNAKPEERVELRLAIDAGSMQEEDDQRGLAHFVEHMCFNGTENFEKNALINFLEKTGVRFGADLNAYTSFDETVYMLQLPTDKEGLVDKGLLVMQDWASAVTFAGDEIDKERGVIKSEWRTRLGAGERMRQAYWPKLFYESRYADRLPIGTTEVIANAPYERLRTFYKDWYRPDLMALVVIGDIDVEEIEKKVKTQFATLKNPANPPEKKLYEVPDHKETFVAVATDKEATSVNLQVIHKHDPIKITTLDDYRTQLTHQLYNQMVNDRYDELGEKPDAPFLYAFSGYGNYVRAKDAYFIQGAAKEDNIEEAIRVILTEQKRVLEHGFTDTELERAKLSLQKSFERANKERDKTTSARFASECVAHFLQDAPMFGIEKEVQLVKDFLPSIKLAEINKLAKQWITKENRAVILTAPAKDGLKIPTEENLRKILEEMENVEVEAYKDKFLDLPLIAQAPKAGKVEKTNKITEKEVDITEWTLSNGVKVILKPTDFQNDQVYLSAFSPGGHSIYEDKDFLTAANADEIIRRAGVGEFDRIALDKKLTGKTVSVSPYISEMYEGFQGNASTEDFETMMKLVHLYATKPRKDKESFEAMQNELMEQMKNALSSPQQYFFNEFRKVTSNNALRRRGIWTDEEIKSISLDRAHEIYKDRFADFSDFTFVMVGNFDPATIKPQVEQYLGSLPATNRKENWKDVAPKAPKGQKVDLKKGLAPQSNVILFFQQDEEWSREKAFELDAAVKVLSIQVRENLREDKGGVYSPVVQGGFGRDPHGTSQVLVFFQCAPEDVDKLVKAVKEEIQILQKEGPSEENVVKFKETRRRAMETSMKKNNFWLRLISDSYQHNESPLEVYKTEKMIESLKAEDIKKAANNFIDLENGVIMTIKPEKEVDDRP